MLPRRSGTFCDASQPFGVLTEKAGADGEMLIREQTGDRSLVLFDSGADEVTVRAGEQGIRVLLISGQPLEEPVAAQPCLAARTVDQLLNYENPSVASPSAADQESSSARTRGSLTPLWSA